ncbi:MAG: Ig-like domain-containing protein, partial [Nitrospirota bacterium]|nr:Ig-like domain-containing protein [Nitrospirota bacterium]
MTASESPNNELTRGKRWRFSWPRIIVPLAILIPAGMLVAKFISNDLTALDDHEITDENKPIKADVLDNDYGLFNRGQLRIVDLQHSMSSQGLCGTARQGLVEIRESAVFFDPGNAFECLGADQEKDIALTYVVEDVPASCVSANAGDLAKLSAEDTAEVQAALNDLLRTGSREPLLIDGVAGPKTRGAIGEWQQIYGFLPSEELSSQQHRCLLDQQEEAKDRSFEDRDAAQLIITVKGANDPPVAKDDRAATSENAPITADVLNNDSDPDNGDQLRVVELEQSADRPGSAELRGNQIVFDPGDDFDGLAAGNTAIVPLTYVVEDRHGG